MDFIDTHVHLSDEQFSADRDEVLRRARASGVSRVVEIADEPNQWEAAVALSRARPKQVRCCLGLHPYYASDFSEGLLEKLRLKTRLPEVVAIGEIGLDYVKTDLLKSVQLAALERLLSAAKAWEKPVVVHCRGAYEDLKSVLKGIYHGPPKERRFWGVVHCFSGSAEDAAFCRDRGFALGVDGPVTYPKNESLREAFRQAGASCLVLETDSPYLPPQSSRGKRNEPSAIPEIAAHLARALAIPVEEMADITSRNAEELFGLPRALK